MVRFSITNCETLFDSVCLVMLYEVYSITSQVLLPKVFNLNVTKLFDLTSSLQNIQITEEQIKNHPMETIR